MKGLVFIGLALLTIQASVGAEPRYKCKLDAFQGERWDPINFETLAQFEATFDRPFAKVAIYEGKKYILSLSTSISSITGKVSRLSFSFAQTSVTNRLSSTSFDPNKKFYRLFWSNGTYEASLELDCRAKD